MPPAPNDLADRLGRELVGCGVVTPAQWREALARAGHPGGALDLLSRVRAHWAPPDDPAPPTALTGHQLGVVRDWLADPSAGGLRRKLVWNDYLLLQPVGEGGMGSVYKGWDRGRGRYVAIKKTLGDSAEIRKRLLREADLLRTLDHPNIARFYSREQLGDDDLLVMEFLPGDTLAEVVRRREMKGKPAPWPFVAELAASLLDALDHAHGNNPAGVVVIHRDVKPANVMLQLAAGNRYHPKLLDMGLGKAVEGGAAGRMEVLTRQFQLLGTPEYMAPEQWDGGDKALPASDVYGLGCTLYYALTGRPPFGVTPEDMQRMAAMAEMGRRHTVDPRPSVLAHRPDVPPALDRLVRKMMAVDPEARGTPTELRARFLELLRDPPPGLPAPAPMTAVHKPYADPSTPRGADRTPRPERPLAKPQPDRTAAGAAERSISRTRSRPAHRAPGPEESLPLADDWREPGPTQTPPTPGLGDVLSTFMDWLGASFGRERRRAAPRLRREFRKALGGWLRSFGRPISHPFRSLLLLSAVVAVGVLTESLGWSLGAAAAAGAILLFGYLLGD